MVAYANGRVCFVLDIVPNSHHKQAHTSLPVFPSIFEMEMKIQKNKASFCQNNAFHCEGIGKKTDIKTLVFFLLKVTKI